MSTVAESGHRSMPRAATGDASPPESGRSVGAALAAADDVGVAVGAVTSSPASSTGSLALTNCVGVPRLFVGSNATQPTPAKYTSGHACS